MAFSELPVRLGALIKNLTPGKMIGLLTLVGCVVTGFILFTMWSGMTDFGVLYSNLVPEDAGAILNEMKEQKIPYRISSNGTSVLIPRERIYETRLELASKGLPQGNAVGFEIFDNTRLGMTEFVQNVNYQRALQGELSRTINGLSEVEGSRVHIVMPSKSLFIDEEKPATASVVLKLRPGKWLGKDQVQGIVHLVSSSISGLTPENVTIVDNSGTMLAGLEKGSTMGQITSDQLEFQEKVEKNLEEEIRTMLETALGPDKAIVRVSCSMDFKQHEKTEEIYSPANRVIRSEQLLSETSQTSETMPMGIPGVTSRMSEQDKTMSGKSDTPSFRKQDRTVNYEIGKVTSHTVEPMGKIEKISVAVIVDGTYKAVKREGKEGGEVKDELEYVPKTQEEMKKLENIVKRAMNFDAERGDEVEVVNMPFESSGLAKTATDIIGEKESWFSKLKQFSPFMKHGFLGVFLLACFVFVVRPLVRWLTASSIGDMEILKHLPKTVEEIENEYAQRPTRTKNFPFKERAIDMITKDTETSAQLVQGWLKES